jgi:hypothetical protein
MARHITLSLTSVTPTSETAAATVGMFAISFENAILPEFRTSARRIDFYGMRTAVFAIQIVKQKIRR